MLFISNVVFIIVASTIPSTGISVWHFDKFGHFCAYCSLSVLLFFAFKSIKTRTIAFLFSIALGCILEWIQSYIPGREMSIYDEIANVIGLLCGAIIYRYFKDSIILVLSKLAKKGER